MNLFKYKMNLTTAFLLYISNNDSLQREIESNGSNFIRLNYLSCTLYVNDINNS